MARPAKLSRERIVAAALDLAAADGGTERLSMRALARALGVDPMAVYRHVADKDDLLGAMCDAAIAELSPLDPTRPWDDVVRDLVVELRALAVARPALVPVLLGAPATPAATALAHEVVGLLVTAGLDEEAATDAFAAVFALTMGGIALEIADPPPAADEAALRRAAAEALGVADPPHLDAAIRLMRATDVTGPGLELLLDGVRARLAR